MRIVNGVATSIPTPCRIETACESGRWESVKMTTNVALQDLTPFATNNAPATFPVGVSTVVWTATDANGNSSATTQLVTVNLVDTLPPVITVPADVYTTTYTSQATVDIGTATAEDNIDGVVAVSNNAPAAFPVGVTTVTYSSSDSAGNTSTATQQVYVSYISVVGGGSGGGSGGGGGTPPPPGGGATVTMEAAYWHHNDHLGTPQAMTDATGTVVWSMSQTPFGIATVNEDPDGDGVAVINNFRFPGQYFDVETGLSYNYFRTYDPALGRYTQSDPIGLWGGMNTFGYVGGNPVNRIDFLGLYQMCHRPVEILPGRHCYVRSDDGSTSSFAPDGIGPERDPNNSDTVCTDSKEPEKDNCIKKEMKKCKGSNYSYTKFNCCHCLEQAMKACGTSISPSDWPNYPINPGPQPGEPGYSQDPVFGPSLGE